MDCFEYTKMFGEVKYLLTTDKLDHVMANGVVEKEKIYKNLSSVLFSYTIIIKGFYCY